VKSGDRAIADDRPMSAHYCLAAPSHPLHGPYHDREYGFPASDEAVLFERLTLAPPWARTTEPPN